MYVYMSSTVFAILPLLLEQLFTNVVHPEILYGQTLGKIAIHIIVQQQDHTFKEVGRDFDMPCFTHAKLYAQGAICGMQCHEGVTKLTYSVLRLYNS